MQLFFFNVKIVIANINKNKINTVFVYNIKSNYHEKTKFKIRIEQN